MTENMHVPQVSIIVSAHNTESYLPRCLDSIRNQAFADWECICVDNGCTDGSGRVMEEYAAKDNRFAVIHKEYGEIGAGRQAGLDAARGEYIGFVDSDDWIEPETYALALDAARRTEADIVQWRLVEEWENTRIPSREFPEGFFELLESPEYWIGCVTIRLFKRSLVIENALRFPQDISAYEDCIFLKEAYIVAYALGKKCFFLNRVLYHLERKRPTSITKGEQYKNTPEILAAYAKETREAIELVSVALARARNRETEKQRNRETEKHFKLSV